MCVMCVFLCVCVFCVCACACVRACVCVCVCEFNSIYNIYIYIGQFQHQFSAPQVRVRLSRRNKFHGHSRRRTSRSCQQGGLFNSLSGLFCLDIGSLFDTGHTCAYLRYALTRAVLTWVDTTTANRRCTDTRWTRPHTRVPQPCR
jgi:hypothetical protein